MEGETAERLKASYRTHFTRMTDDDWLAAATQLYRETAAGVRLDYDPALADQLGELTPETVPDLWLLFNALSDVALMMIQGENSDILSSATVREAIAARPDMRFVHVAGEGHAPLLWDKETQTEIHAFLTGSR